MPIAAPIAAGLISAGGSLLSGIFGSSSQSSTNAANIAFQRQMMNQQRRWAVLDWDKQNAYNSPKATMQRFEDAGLNKHLIYGNQSSNASPVRSTDTPSSPGLKPTYPTGMVESMLSGFLSMYDLQKTQAETNNLAKQAELIDAQRRLAEANTTGKDLDNFRSTSSFDYDMEAKRLRNKQTAAGILNTNADTTKKQADTVYTLSENERRAALQAPNLELAVQRVIEIKQKNSLYGIERATMEQKLKLLKYDTTVRELDAKLAKQGIRPGDPLWYRAVASTVNTILDYKPGEPKEDLKTDILQSLFAKPGQWQKK